MDIKLLKSALAAALIALLTFTAVQATDEAASAKEEALIEELNDETVLEISPEVPSVNSAAAVAEDETQPPAESLTEVLLQPSLQILATEVQPGTAKVVNWAFETTFADLSVPVPVLVVNGNKPGPTLCLTAAVHGDELNGIEIVRRVVHATKPAKLSGAIIGVPIVNLQGFQRASRYLPDRRDLNRYFPGREHGSYASRVAHAFFNQIITHCNYLVDLHTGSLSRTNLPQIRANLSDPAVASLAEKMGSIVVLQSRGGIGTLRRAASDAGIPAVTLEAGAPNNLQKEAVEEGIKTIKSALSSLGMSNKPLWKRSEEPVFYRSQWIRAKHGGILFSKVELGDNIEKNTVLGLLSDPITNKTTKIRSPIAGRIIGMALNQVMYPGFAAYHVGLRSSMVEAALKEELEEELEEDQINDDQAAESDHNLKSETVIAADVESSRESKEDEAPESDINLIEEMELPTADSD